MNPHAVLLCSILLTAANVAVAHEPARFVIDGHAAGTVIAPQLFGHNLEVTRRGVWRGLGAEMVANRKFAAVNSGLPKRWAVIGPRAGAQLDTTAAFTGKQSVRLEGAVDGQPFGLSQTENNLAFLKDARYVVRVWVKSQAERDLQLGLTDASGHLAIAKQTWTVKPGDWQPLNAEFASPATAENCRLEITSTKAGSFLIGAVSVQLADTLYGMRRDVIKLLRQIQPGALRFPGGCYAEYYRWQDGLLPVDRRSPIGPTRLNFLLRDGDDVDPQELGIDEFVALCRELHCEPAITLRLSEMTVEESAAWVEYCNGGPETKWGKVRIERGHREPYRVKTWFLGNELYFFGRGRLNKAEPAARQSRQLADAIKSVDPSVRLVACTTPGGLDDWNRRMLSRTGDSVQMCSTHDYAMERFKSRDLAELAKAPTQYLRPRLRQMHEAVKMPLCFDEWNTMWGQRGSVGMALYAAGVLNLLVREADQLGIEQAYFFMPINEGAIEVLPLAAQLDLAGPVFEMMKVHQGNVRLKTGDTPADADIDLSASRTPDGKRLYVTIVNRDAVRDREVELTMNHFALPRAGSVRQLVPKSRVVDGREFMPTGNTTSKIDGNRMQLTVPAASVSRVTIELEK